MEKEPHVIHKVGPSLIYKHADGAFYKSTDCGIYVLDRSGITERRVERITCIPCLKSIRKKVRDHGKDLADSLRENERSILSLNSKIIQMQVPNKRRLS